MSRVMNETPGRARGRSVWRAAASRRAAGLLAMFAAAALVAVACRDSVPTAGFTHVAGSANLVTVDSAKKLSLAYVCGTQWRIRNPLADSVLVHWDVLNKSDTGSVILAPAPSSGTYSQTFFKTRTYGFTRLYFQGAQVQSAIGPNAIHGTVCPGNLTIVAGRGVVGLSSGSTAYTNGTTVSYSAVPDNGYTNVQLFLDTLAIPSSGTITIAGAQTLVAVATLDATAVQVDQGIEQRFHALLTSATPVAAFQSLIYAAGALVDQLGSDQADSVIYNSAAAAFHLPGDSVALAQLERALAGHSFESESLPPREDALVFGPGSTLPYGFPSNSSASSLRLIAGPRGSVASPRAQIVRASRAGGIAAVGTAPAPSDPRPLNIVHINGLNVDFAGFTANIQSLRSAVRQLPQFADTRTARVTGIYNANVGLTKINLSSTPCVLALVPQLAARLPWFWRVDLTKPCTAAGLHQMARDGGGDVLETLVQLQNILANAPPTLTGITLDSLVSTQLSAKQGGDHVIVVPHSQGNLFEIQSLATLAGQGNAPSDTDAACVGMVPTASPTSVGYPMSSLRLRSVQQLGDFILYVPPPPYSVPKFPAVSTPLYQSFAGDFLAAAADSLGLTNSIPFIVAATDGLAMHSFGGSYLANMGARSLMQQAIADIYANCEISVSVAGDPLIATGSSQQMSAIIAGADGRHITPVVPIVWQSSDTTVAQIDATGNLTARALGEIRVTATYRGQHGDAFVAVYSTSPDTTLTVTVVSSAVDQAPFWLDRPTDVWRRRDVSVSVTPTDSFTIVATVDVNGYDSYGTFYTSIPLLQPGRDGSRTLQAFALFFDNPRLNGVPERFQMAGRLFVMSDEVFVRIITSLDGVGRAHWVRVPLTSP